MLVSYWTGSARHALQRSTALQKPAQTVGVPPSKGRVLGWALELREMYPLRYQAQHSRPKLDLGNRPYPHGEEQPDRDMVSARTQYVEDHHAAYEDLKGQFLLQPRITLDS